MQYDLHSTYIEGTRKKVRVGGGGELFYKNSLTQGSHIDRPYSEQIEHKIPLACIISFGEEGKKKRGEGRGEKSIPFGRGR